MLWDLLNFTQSVTKSCLEAWNPDYPASRGGLESLAVKKNYYYKNY